MNENKTFQSGIGLSATIINSKYKPTIIQELAVNKHTMSDLNKIIKDIKLDDLKKNLDELIDFDLVKIDNSKKGTVYSLTGDGMALRSILVELAIWGEEKVHSLNQKGKNIKLVHSSRNDQ